MATRTSTATRSRKSAATKGDKRANGRVSSRRGLGRGSAKGRPGQRAPASGRSSLTAGLARGIGR
ncbi:MAG TPA: hypothetical protein VJ644_09670, partial [Jiangellaceae bacterium]|nr:hypothetical protein [Jiangellaceae bacterium]